MVYLFPVVCPGLSRIVRMKMSDEGEKSIEQRSSIFLGIISALFKSSSFNVI